MKIVVDYDILFEVLRARDKALLVKWSVLVSSQDDILFSPLAAAKIWPRVQPKEHPAISRLFRTLVCTPIDYKIGHLAGELFRQYSKSHNIEMADAVTAAITIQNQAALWTRNRKHFPVAELTLY